MTFTEIIIRKKIILKVIRVFAVAVIALPPVGCDNFLVKPLQGQLSQQNFPTTADDALLATNGAYNDLRTNTYHFGYFPIIDIMSDDARKGSNPGDQNATIGQALHGPQGNF